jgi:quinol monooxygenase YgiN
MMSELTFIGTARAKPGHADDLEREMRSTVAAMHAEPGCIHYSMHNSLEDQNVFVFIERWASKEDLDKHFESDHVKSLIARTQSMMDGMPEMQMFEMVDVPEYDKKKSAFSM